ncbi:hypothetical protein LTR86_008771 [Recurvomyces mirabilis]|nr:hypothetical protein LTR86_008771 [Recurvomyces mirabilis]
MVRVSTFDMHHRTNLIFPCLDLTIYVQETAEMLIYGVHNSAMRYEPLPLIEHAAVAAHADRTSEEETSYYSLTNAVRDIQVNALVRPNPELSAAELVEDMALIIKTVGETTMKLLAVATEEGYKLIIERTTEHKSLAGNFRSTGVHIFNSAGCPTHFDMSEQWMRDLHDLICRRNDRAVRHVVCQLAKQELMSVSGSWKPKRKAELGSQLPGQTLRLALDQLPDDQKTCLCCTVDYNDTSTRPHHLSCDARHIVCWKCLLKWCTETGPTAASCPHCRSKVFQDSAIVESLIFGTVNDGKAYFYDKRFTAYENAERVMADIDRELAEYNNNPITVDHAALMDVFQWLQASARLESEDSTPLHLQPVRMPEFPVFAEAVEVALVEHHGETLPISQLYRRIYIIFATHVTRERKRGTMARYGFHAADSLPHSTLPGGFEEYVKRTISRMLQFLHLRRCAGPCPFVGKVHDHGLKRYWS